jgi:cell division protein FtsI (penicillin-binding protein 3)
VRFLSVCVLVVLALFSGRLVYVQAYLGTDLAASAQAMRTITVTIPAVRGEITDADGIVLATSVTRYDVFADQENIEDWKHSVDGEWLQGAAEAARLLSPILDVPVAELTAKLTRTGDNYNKHAVLKKEVTPEAWEAIRELEISGIFADTKVVRSYPAGTTGGNLIGFVGADGDGKSGLEYALDDTLAGKAGSKTYERGSSGQVIPTGEQSSVAATSGDGVTLTLLTDLQWKAQSALDEQIAAMGATGGFVVVMDIETGAIYALADSGSLDPNNPTGYSGVKAISTLFDPGSTAKVITMAAALETGLATPTSTYEVPYNYTTANGQTFKDSHEHGTEQWTLTGILANSSNTGTVMVGENIPKQVRHDYLTKFGLGSKTGIELAGEEKGLLADADAWDGRTQYAVLFGQGLSVTALQATSVFATIANGGVKVEPHLVAGTTDESGTFTPSTQTAPEQVVSEATADAVLKMMESAVVDGTGSTAAIDGYRVAGKTGTAQVPDSDGQLTGILASFVGVAPADDPKLAVGVFIENPNATEYSIYGGVSAAPVFSEVTSFALQQLGIVPTGSTPDLFPSTW